MQVSTFLFVWSSLLCCDCYKILGVFPGKGRSHHIMFSSLMEELASKNHDVTVINYFPVNKMPNIRQISLFVEYDEDAQVNMTETLTAPPPIMFVDLYNAYEMALLFKVLANENCQRMMVNPEIRQMIEFKERFDVVIVEQFVTDCSLAIAHMLNSPTMGISAHMIMPWTYSRLGAPNHPAFVPNHLFATGTRPSTLNKIKSAIINVAMTTYYSFVIQSSDKDIVSQYYPEYFVPDFESLGRNLSLILVNQYFPLTGSRVQGSNVIEVGGMHVETHQTPIEDKDLKYFLDNAKENVVYISFGTVAANFPETMIQEIIKFIEWNKNKLKFVWKVDNDTIKVDTKRVFLTKWLPQPTVLCHPNVVAFVSHSGMLSTSEAIHCGVPMVAVPLFGDQFSNAAAVVEKGLGVAVDIHYDFYSFTLHKALETVLQNSYIERAKHLSRMWRDRPTSAMDTAVYWVEYVARNKHLVDMKPSTVHLTLVDYLFLDAILLMTIVAIIVIKLSELSVCGGT